MVFPSNQNRQFFVVNSFVTSGVTEASPLGALSIKGAGNQFYFLYKGAKGVMRTKYIDKDKIISCVKSPATKQARKLHTVDLTLNAGHTFKTNELYLVRVHFTQAFGLDEGMTYQKDGNVKIFDTTDESSFWAKMASSLWMNFSREISSPVKIQLIKTKSATNTYTDVTGVVDASALGEGETYTGIRITEVMSEYQLGLTNNQGTPFTVTAVALDDATEWGKVADKYDVEAVNNGRVIADMESFYMGERGVQGQPYGYPKNIKVKLIADPTAAYDTLDIWFYNDADPKQKIEITFAAPSSVMTSIVSTTNGVGKQTTVTTVS